LQASRLIQPGSRAILGSAARHPPPRAGAFRSAPKTP